ncbi:MAG: arginine decarboxylase, partial [Bacteroidia bacterium]
GQGGIKHCLIPSPKKILLYKDAEGNIIDELFAEEQNVESMMKILGY